MLINAGSRDADLRHADRTGYLAGEYPAAVVPAQLFTDLLSQRGTAVHHGQQDTVHRQMGIDLQTVILASSVLYELTGPACAKLSLYLSGSYGDIELPKEAKEKDPVTRLEMLIERIHEIQQEIPETEENISPEEQAFLEAANEQYEAVGALRNHLRARRTY